MEMLLQLFPPRKGFGDHFSLAQKLLQKNSRGDNTLYLGPLMDGFAAAGIPLSLHVLPDLEFLEQKFAGE